MEKILSQNEIDALLRGIEEGKVENGIPERKNEAGVSPYDFANPDEAFRGQIPAFQVLNDQFPRLFKTTLSSMLRKLIDIRPSGFQTKRFGDFIKSLPVPSSLHILKMEPLRGHSLLVLDSKLIFTLLDLFFGGPGKSAYKIEGRDFTVIESRFISKLVTEILGDFEKAWQPVYPFKIQHLRSEVNPEVVALVPPGDPVITLEFKLELEQFEGGITFCIPCSLIKPIKVALYTRFELETLEADPQWIERFLDRIKEAEVGVSVELGRRQIPIRDFVNFKIGDTLLLERDTSEPLVAKVEGVPKFTGRAGLYGSNRAIQIEERVKTL